MTSIRARLLYAFGIVIGIMVAVSAALVIGHVSIINRYEEVDNTIFEQFSLINSTRSLIRFYNDYRNDSSEANLKMYNDERQNVRDTIAHLERDLVSADSRAALAGAKGTIEGVIAEVDAGIQSIRRGDIIGTSERYAEANRKFSFVQENVGTSILAQLEYAETVQKKNRSAEVAGLTFASGLLLAVTVACASMAFAFANRLVNPLTRLAQTAQKIARGQIETPVDPSLLKINDEVGIMANSFAAMVTSLDKTILGLKDANEQVSQGRAELVAQNETLEKLNHLFVIREQRIKELKEQVAHLTGKEPVGDSPGAAAETIAR